MTSDASLVFKVATEAWELEQVHRLNYRTFVEEIPQHAPNPDARLVDKFDDENTYLICLRGRRLIGMMAVRANRPFSLDAKLPDLDRHLPPGRRVCELRLLAVDPAHRGGRVLLGLMEVLDGYCAERGYDLAIISGTTRQQKLYRHLGFVPFGPLVGSDDARFQPMYLTLEAAEARAKPLLSLRPAGAVPPLPVNLLPGPVAVARATREAFAAPPASHRTGDFVATVRRVRARLGDLVGARHVAVLPGSGTLANDVVAGQLALLGGRGVIVASGEFGERLVDHARRVGLAFDTLCGAWGVPVAPDAITAALDRSPGAAWLWTPLCETSTGVRHDLAALATLCAARQVRLCLDAVSAVGTIPLDLRGVHLAAASSGKGLAAYPGLALVFADELVPPAPRALPRALDLGAHLAGDGVPSTLSSNLVHALEAALRPLANPAARECRYAAIAELAAWLRGELGAAGLAIVAPEGAASPAVTTVALPAAVSSAEVGDGLADAGFLVSYRSRYLLERNWVQLCLMGDLEGFGGSVAAARERLAPLPGLLGGHVRKRTVRAS